MDRLQKAFIASLGLLLIVLLSGTIYAMAHKTRDYKLARQSQPAAPAGQELFTGIGRIRTLVLAQPGSLVLANIVFPYDAANRSFADELAMKRQELRQASIQFMAERQIQDLQPAAEPALKAGLRDTLNSLLFLGQIDDIYFSEFDVLH